ncbi:MAG: helicase [Frondihabitans sp.]|nr:helicase [Frondihabitans sp.]
MSTPRTNTADKVGRRLGSDSGAISVIAVALLAIGVTTTAAVAGSASLLVERHRLGGAADAAALAAADAASGLIPGEPCDAASRLAESNSVSLGACDVDGSTVTVTVSSTLSGVPIEVTATAGQPSWEESSTTDASKK